MIMALWILVALIFALSITFTRRRALTYRAGVGRALTGVMLVVGAAFTLVWMSVGNSDPAALPLLTVMQSCAIVLGVVTVTASVFMPQASAPGRPATR